MCAAVRESPSPGRPGGSPRNTRWTVFRRISQVFSLAFFIALPASQIPWPQDQLIGTLASLRIGPISLVDPSVGFATIFAARDIVITLLSGMILPVAAALLLGPFFCAWICPWGFFSELIDRVKHRRRSSGRRLTALRLTILAGVLLAGTIIGVPIALFISAPRLVTLLPLEIILLGGATLTTLLFLGIILALEVLTLHRLWCRVLCPVGSMLTFLRAPNTPLISWRVRECRPQECGVVCVAACSWRLDPRRVHSFDGCTNCGACIDACPGSTRKALHFAPAIKAMRRTSHD